jgi:hypothetical protein
MTVGGVIFLQNVKQQYGGSPKIFWSFLFDGVTLEPLVLCV